MLAKKTNPRKSFLFRVKKFGRRCGLACLFPNILIGDSRIKGSFNTYASSQQSIEDCVYFMEHLIG